jgi:hypothetical protein
MDKKITEKIASRIALGAFKTKKAYLIKGGKELQIRIMMGGYPTFTAMDDLQSDAEALKLIMLRLVKGVSNKVSNMGNKINRMTTGSVLVSSKGNKMYLSISSFCGMYLTMGEDEQAELSAFLDSTGFEEI